MFLPFYGLQALGGIPLGYGIVVGDRTPERSYNIAVASQANTSIYRFLFSSRVEKFHRFFVLLNEHGQCVNDTRVVVEGVLDLTVHRLLVSLEERLELPHASSQVMKVLGHLGKPARETDSVCGWKGGCMSQWDNAPSIIKV